MPDASYNKVVIIESLDGENTGHKLFDELRTSKAMLQHGATVEYHPVRTAIEFITTLEAIESVAVRDKSRPIIHFDIHGSNEHDGFILASRDFVPWEALKSPITKLNVTTGNNLILTLAVCHGARLIEIVSPVERSPFWVMVAPANEVPAIASMDGFAAYYHEIFSTGKAGKALVTLNDHMPPPKSHYQMIACEALFGLAFRTYQERQLSPQSLRQWTSDARAELKKRGVGNVPSMSEIKRLILRSQKPVFDQMRDRFFMCDLFPENRGRCTLKYENFSKPK